MATVWAENLIGLYNPDGTIISANITPPAGTTWEIKKSHIVELRTAIEGLFLSRYGSVLNGWAAFDSYQNLNGKRRFTAWTNNNWDRYYFSHVDDIRQIVNFLEVEMLYSLTTFPTIVPLYDNNDMIIVGNLGTFSKVSVSHIVSLRNRINVLEGIAYTYLDYSLCYDTSYIDTVDSPYLKASMAEIDQSNSVVRSIAAPSTARHEFTHANRSATRIYLYDDNIGPDSSVNGYMNNYGGSRSTWTNNGIILSIKRDGYNDDPYIASARIVGLANNSFYAGTYEDCYIKITGHGVGIRILASRVGGTVTPALPALPYSFCQYKYSSVYDDNTLYSSGRSGWIDYYGFADSSHPGVFVSMNGEAITNVFNGDNALFPLSGLWLGKSLRYREIKLFDTNTDFTILLRDGVPCLYTFAHEYCRLGIIMRAS